MSKLRWNGEQRIEDADALPSPKRPVLKLLYLIALHGFALWGVVDAVRLVFEIARTI